MEVAQVGRVEEIPAEERTDLLCVRGCGSLRDYVWSILN